MLAAAKHPETDWETLVSALAAVVYLVEFVGRFAAARWRSGVTQGSGFFTRGRTVVILGAVAPLASFFVPRVAALTLTGFAFAMVVANEYRLWRGANASTDPATSELRELLRRARGTEKYIDSADVKKAGNPGWLVAYARTSAVLADVYALIEQELPEHLSDVDSGETTRSGWQEGPGPVMEATEAEMRDALAKAISGLETILRSPAR